MDYLAEIVALGIDSVILVACIKQYYKNKQALTMIQDAPTLTINKDLKEIVKMSQESKIPYCSIRGTVKPLGNPIISSNNPNVSGVVQLLRIKEHVIQRSTTGFWADSERTIQEVHNVMPFGLGNNGILVEIADPLCADILDMDVISDTFHPTIPSMMDHIWGFFAGVRQRGVQSTEKMLRKGAVLTGIGELVYGQDGSVRLQPPSSGAPFYLTTMQTTSLIKKLDASRKNYRLLCLLVGTIGIVLTGLIVRKYFTRRKTLKEEEERKVKLEEVRKERRRRIRDEQVADHQLCIVCKSNPIELILLPCGHVCLCEDCSIDITENCPVCRTKIERKSVAYVV